MYWRIVIDYGTFRNYHPVHSSEFAANLIANNWREIARYRKETVRIFVEEVKEARR